MSGIYNINRSRIQSFLLFFSATRKMPDYCFYQKGQHTVVLERHDADGGSQLEDKGYIKQFEEVSATDKHRALNRFADIRRSNQKDHHDFFSGAIAMPLMGVLTAIAVFLLRKK
ncbi:hypothetical protein [Pantoea ananatis]|uniref:hypothetical protein n=1 Tax=Pantoea ananas TaxID=553 RepID=UPI003F9C5FF6